MTETISGSSNVIPFPRAKPTGTYYRHWRSNDWHFFTYRDGAWAALTEQQAEDLQMLGYSCTTIR